MEQWTVKNDTDKIAETVQFKHTCNKMYPINILLMWNSKYTVCHHATIKYIKMCKIRN